MIWRSIPLLILACFLCFGLVVRCAIQLLRYGVSGFVHSRAPRERWRGIISLVLFGLMTSQALSAARGETPIVESPILRGLGAVLGFGGVALMVSAQLNMGVSWRVGIDESARPGLVTGGWHSLSRNPIYLFLLVSIGGVVILIPNGATIAAYVLMIFGVTRLVIEEEQYLERIYGDEYRRYADRVGRFLPRAHRRA